MSASPDFIAQNDPFTPTISNEVDNTNFQREINENNIINEPISNAVMLFLMKRNKSDLSNVRQKRMSVIERYQRNRNLN